MENHDGFSYTFPHVFGLTINTKTIFLRSKWYLVGVFKVSRVVVLLNTNVHLLLYFLLDKTTNTTQDIVILETAISIVAAHRC